MTQLLSIWWVWVAAGLILAIAETLLPGFILLGFAIGAAITGILVYLGLSLSPAPLLLLFAILSLATWIVLKRSFSLKTGSVKKFDHDINDT